jgi:hypothetical protein
MRPNIRYSDNLPTHIMLENTSTGKKVQAEVASRSDTAITVFLANEKIVLHRQAHIYVANKFGMELVYNPESTK